MGLLLLGVGISPAGEAPELKAPNAVLKGVSQKLSLSLPFDSGRVELEGIGFLDVNGGEATYEGRLPHPIHIHYIQNEKKTSSEFALPVIPGFVTLLPPLVAILCAYLFKNVMIALFLGVFAGAMPFYGYNPLTSIFQVVNEIFVEQLTDSTHIRILVFTFLIAGFVGIIRKSGAMEDLVSRLTRFVKTPRSGMLTTWFSGLIIFFDDYANSLLLGQMMRPLTDKLKISREKLSYLVDSTAAPMATLCISTWIGTQISLMHDSAASLGIKASGMELFIKSWPYNFYSLFTLLFAFFLISMNRDFGPMLPAEKRARKTGKVHGKAAMPMQQDEPYFEKKFAYHAPWWKALLSIFVMLASVIFMMGYSGIQGSGTDRSLSGILNNADTVGSLVFGPVAGILAFCLLSLGKWKAFDIAESLYQGARSLFLSAVILTLAWSLGSLCGKLETSSYLIHILGGSVPAAVYPPVLFLLASLISLCTGTSWGTMAILFPISMPLVNAALLAAGEVNVAAHPLFLASLASILTGSVFGDHISPISDTTLFSSMACGADHIHHVKTQAPYGITVSAICLLFAYLPLALGLHWLVSWALGISACVLTVRLLGQKPDNS